MRTLIEPRGFIARFDSPDMPHTSRSRHRTIVAESDALDFGNTPPTNPLVLFRHGMRTMRLNKGSWRAGAREEDQGRFEGFSLETRRASVTRTPKKGRSTTLTIENLMVSPRVDSRWSEPSSTSPPSDLSEVWFFSPKTTDGLFLSPEKIEQGVRLDPFASTSVRACALSAAHLLVSDVSRELDLDPEEFDVVEPRIRIVDGHFRVPLLQITDRLINGAGYCRELSRTREGDDEPWILKRMDALLDHEAASIQDFLDEDHRRHCETSCYVCMQRYGNQGYHGLLDWRLGLAYLHALRRPGSFVEELMNLDETSRVWGVDWSAQVERHVITMASTYDNVEQFIAFDELPCFEVETLAREKRFCIPMHPLCDPCSPIAIEGSMLILWQKAEEEALARTGHRALFVDSFELARRMTHVRALLREGCDVGGWR